MSLPSRPAISYYRALGALKAHAIYELRDVTPELRRSDSGD